MSNTIKKRIKQVLLCMIILFGIILGTLPREAYAELPDTDFYSGKIVVKTDDLSNLPEGGEILSESEGMYLVDYESPSEAERAFLAMEDNPDILASPEASFVICTGDEIKKAVPRETEDALNSIEENVPDYSEENVIALIDTGAKSEDVMAAYSVLSDDGRDTNGHGSLMVEAIKSVDSDAKIVSIKALNKSGAGSISSVYAGIKLAIKMNVKVINLSIVAKSVSENEIIKDAIREALNNNIVVVGAAGNNGDLASKYIPGCINGVVLVGACNENGKRLESSNYGDEVDWLVTADSTSKASAKLASFIAKNCESDRTLNSKIEEEVGKGLIFYPENKANNSEKKDEFSDIKWREINPDSLTKEELEFFSGENEFNSLKLSEDGELLMLTTTDYAVPDDGTFVPAAWEYAKITSSSVLRMNNVYGSSGLKENQNQITVTTNGDGTLSKSGSLLDGFNYRIVGFTFNYIPGTFERSDRVSDLGESYVTEESMKLLSKWRDGLWDRVVTSGVKTYHADNQTGMVQLSFWPESDTCLQYLYKSNVRLYLKDLNFNEKPVRDSYMTNDHSIWYEEGEVGSAELAEIATDGSLPYHAEVGLTLRKYKVYYQGSSNPSNLYYAGEGIVGAPFDFSTAERSAASVLVNKSLGWNYDAFGTDKRPGNAYEIVPKTTTPTEVGKDGEVYFKFVVKPSGSNKPGLARLSVLAKENMTKVAGAKFNLMHGTDIVKRDLLTNGNGEIVLNDLSWAGSWDVNGHDGNYILTPVSVPAGYILPREVPFGIEGEDVNANREVSLQRLLEIENRTISLESVVNVEDAPINVFTYTISGRDVSGKEHTYSCTVNERYERTVPAGIYKVEVSGKPGYMRMDTEYLDNFAAGDITDLSSALRGSIRYMWEYNEPEEVLSGDVCVNSFRR